MTDEVGRYLYEPNASILKAGAFKLLTMRMMFVSCILIAIYTLQTNGFQLFGSSI